MYEIIKHMDYLDCIKLFQLNNNVLHNLNNSTLIMTLIYKIRKEHVINTVDQLKIEYPNNEILFNKYCKIGNYHIINELISRGYIVTNNDFVEVVKAGHSSIAFQLMEYNNIDPSFKNNWPLQLCIKSGYDSILKRLLNEPKVMSILDFSQLFESSCNYGHLSIINELIKRACDNKYFLDFDKVLDNIEHTQNNQHVMQRLLWEIEFDKFKYTKYLFLAHYNNYVDILDDLLTNRYNIDWLTEKYITNTILDLSFDLNMMLITLLIITKYKIPNKFLNHVIELLITKNLENSLIKLINNNHLSYSQLIKILNWSEKLKYSELTNLVFSNLNSKSKLISKILLFANNATPEIDI